VCQPCCLRATYRPLLLPVCATSGRPLGRHLARPLSGWDRYRAEAYDMMSWLFDSDADRASKPTRAGRLAASFCLLIALSIPSLLHAHLALVTSAPAAGDQLLAAPDVLRLTFTEPVELDLSTLVLRGPGGEVVTLGDLGTVEARDVITASIVGGLVAGSYTVVWQAVGRDGHPVQGEYTFFIGEGATGLAVPVTDPLPNLPSTPSPPEAELPSFSPQSPLYAGVRWMSYAGIIGVLGAIGFAGLLSSPRMKAASVSTAFRENATRGAAAIGLVAVLLLGVSMPLRLQAQAYTLFGEGVSAERFELMTGTTWGVAWIVQSVGTLIALGGLFLAWRGARSGWVLAAGGALLLVATPAMSGHAASVENWRGLAMGADALHVLSAGLWVGTLGVLLAVGVPLTRKASESERRNLLSTLVGAFTPLALVAAGVLFATGLAASVLHLSAVADLWMTPYGRLLSAKLLLVLVVMALGAYNWRRVRPVLDEAGGDRRFMRSAGGELVAATLVVALTAILVAVPAPAHSASSVATAPAARALSPDP